MRRKDVTHDVAGFAPTVTEQGALHTLLTSLIEQPIPLGSQVCVEIGTRVAEKLAPSMIAMGRRSGLGCDWLENADIVHTVLLELCKDDCRVAKQILLEASDPWQYLARCAMQWSRALWGHRCIPLEATQLMGAATYFEFQTEPSPLEQAVDLACELLRPHTAYVLRPQLHELLTWLSLNPPSRLSYEAEDQAAFEQHYPSVDRSHLKALTKVAWGSRPRRAETSLLGAVLRNPSFQPAQSYTHAAALVQYRRTMRAQRLMPQGFALQHERIAA